MEQLEALASYISIPVPKAWENCYEAAMARYRADWLDDYDFDAILDYYEFEKDFYYDRLHRELELLRQDATLNRICWLMHYVLFYGETSDFLNIWSWGKGVKAFAEHGSPTTCVVALLAGQPIHAENMAVRCYDQEQIAIHRRGVRVCWTGQRNKFGIDGVGFNYMIWGAQFIRCTLVRLGRLEYECGLKHFGQYDEQFGGDPVYVYIHIPRADNGLQDDEVEQSIRMAAERLEQCFPQVRGKQVVFCTRTWLLSPELREILKPTSNIIQFQNRFTITEHKETVDPFLSFGFGVTPGPDVDYAALPEDTSLRRALKERLLRGEKLHDGWGYFTL